MPFVYSAVARGQVVLAQYTSYTGNLPEVAQDLLGKLQQRSGNTTVSAEQHNFNFLFHDPYTFVVVSTESEGRTMPYSYLNRVKDDFLQKFGEKAKTLPAGALSKDYSKKLRDHMKYVQENVQEFSKVAAVQKKVDDVKGVMFKNVQTVVERGERLEVMVGKAEDLSYEAKSFQKQSKEVKSVMWWQSCRMQLLLVGAMLLLAGVIFCSVCFTNGNCIKDRKDADAVYKLYAAAMTPGGGGSRSSPRPAAASTNFN